MVDAINSPGLDRTVAVVNDLAVAFGERGRRLYLVGGVVRDLLLDRSSDAEDIDLTTDADPAVIKELVRPLATALWTQGERFGTIGATVNGRDLEITTHRAEAYEPGSRKPVVAFGDSLTEDLSRRDFTINAMAVSVPDGELIDPYDGRGDLDRRRLATPLSPAQSFTDDPLRMLRAARFLPRFDLESEPGLEQAATELAGRLSIVSVERIHDELERLLALEAPGPGLDFLVRTGLLVEAIPGIAGGDDTVARSIGLAAAAPTTLTRRAGLLLRLGPEVAAQSLNRLRYPRAVVRETLAMIEAMGLIADREPDPALVRTMVTIVGADGVAELRALAALAGAGSELFDLHDELAASEDLADLRSPLTGRQIMEHLAIASGPLVGEATSYLREERIRKGPISPSDAFALLDSWWRSADRGAP